FSTSLRVVIGTYLGVKSLSTSTPSSRSGRSRTWPIEASSWYPLPKKLLSVFVLVGDSTIIRDFAIREFLRLGRGGRACAILPASYTFVNDASVPGVFRAAGIFQKECV